MRDTDEIVERLDQLKDSLQTGEVLSSFEVRQRMLSLMIGLLSEGDEEEGEYTLRQQAAMLREAFLYLEGQLHRRHADFVKQVEDGHCQDFALSDAELGGGEKLPRPGNEKCQELFDPESLGLPADFDMDNCSFSEALDVLKRVARVWKEEADALADQL